MHFNYTHGKDNSPPLCRGEEFLTQQALGGIFIVAGWSHRQSSEHEVRINKAEVCQESGW